MSRVKSLCTLFYIMGRCSTVFNVFFSDSSHQVFFKRPSPLLHLAVTTNSKKARVADRKKFASVRSTVDMDPRDQSRTVDRKVFTAYGLGTASVVR